MIRIQSRVTINRPLEEVFRFMTDNQNALQWQSGLLEARVTNDIAGVGRAWVDVVQFLGRRIEIASQTTDFEPWRLVRFKSTSGPIPLEGGYSFEPAGQGTKVTFDLQGEAGGFFKLAEPIVARATQRQWDTNLANLKDLLEQRDDEQTVEGGRVT
jgi:uncharacterized membrane protein